LARGGALLNKRDSQASMTTGMIMGRRR